MELNRRALVDDILRHVEPPDIDQLLNARAHRLILNRRQSIAKFLNVIHRAVDDAALDRVDETFEQPRIVGFVKVMTRRLDRRHVIIDVAGIDQPRVMPIEFEPIEKTAMQYLKPTFDLSARRRFDLLDLFVRQIQLLPIILLEPIEHSKVK